MDAQTIVVGGGTCGAAIAARLAESGFDVLLLEAGPDYGPVNSGRWPAELLDPSTMPVDSHSWGFVDRTLGIDLERARVIGGCSSHNGCACVWGHRSDYDRWAAAGNVSWGTDDLIPYLQRATDRLQVTTPARHDVTPLHQAMLAAGPAAGLPVLDDLLSLEVRTGIGIGPVNIVDGIRWNAAFAYLDPIRSAPNFSIIDRSIVNRLETRGNRVVSVIVTGANGEQTLRAERVVLAAGSYGTPAILQRSGIGDPSDLVAADVPVQHVLPGVGKNLQDHPAVEFEFAGSANLTRQLEEFVAGGGLPREEGTIVFANSARSERPFDLHIYPIASRVASGVWQIYIGIALMAPKSRGSVRITSADPEVRPLINSGFLTDSADYDCDALLDGIAVARQLASTEQVASLMGEERGAIAEITERSDLTKGVRESCSHDYHPAGTCRMGRAGDPMAVVGHGGIVHGLEDLYIGDASIMPSVPVSNTMIPALAVAEKVAAGLQMIVRI